MGSSVSVMDLYRCSKNISILSVFQLEVIFFISIKCSHMILPIELSKIDILETSACTVHWKSLEFFAHSLIECFQLVTDHYASVSICYFLILKRKAYLHVCYGDSISFFFLLCCGPIAFS